MTHRYGSKLFKESSTRLIVFSLLVSELSIRSKRSSMWTILSCIAVTAFQSRSFSFCRRSFVLSKRSCLFNNDSLLAPKSLAAESNSPAARTGSIEIKTAIERVTNNVRISMCNSILEKRNNSQSLLEFRLHFLSSRKTSYQHYC